MKAKINKQIELVQILLYLAEEQEKTVQCLNNKIYLRQHRIIADEDRC